MPDADPLDLLCHLAFNGPLRTRRERAQRLSKNARGLLRTVWPGGPRNPQRLVDKYAEHGLDQLRLPDVLKLPPLSSHGNPSEIATHLAGHKLRQAVDELRGDFSMPRESGR